MLALSEQDHSRALARLGQALDLCREDPQAVNETLSMLAGVALAAPELCATALDAFRGVEPSADTGYLRAFARLNYVCEERTSNREHFSALIEHLVDRYGTDVPGMRSFVERYQRAQLYHWVGDEARFTRFLTDATATLCSDDELLSRAIRIMGQHPAGPDNPGGLFGLWTLRPAGTIDEPSRRCLARAADHLERELPDYRPELVGDAESMLAWLRSIEP